MKIAALTMVYRDYWALAQWYRHHGKQLGEENLFVVAHGVDNRISEICPKASIITVPRDSLERFDRNRGELLNGFQAGLLKVYDWVIRTDADELICWDPGRYDSLADMFRHQDVPVLTALGFDLVGAVGDVFSDIRDAAFSGHYSKAFATSEPIGLMLHGAKIANGDLETFPFQMPQGVYLAHLKYANTVALNDAILVRQSVGAGTEDGLPGDGWKHAAQDAVKFRQSFDSKRWLTWSKAEAHAYKSLSVKPSRLSQYGVVKTRALKFDHRTTLPDWFGDL